MKQKILSLFIVISLTMQAQITYQSSHHIIVGDSIHISQSNKGLHGINFDTTGINLIWDYSALVPVTQADEKYIDSKDAGYKTTWCLANGHIVGCNTKYEDYSNIATQELEGFTLGSISFENVVKHYKKEDDNFVYKMLGTTIMIGGLPVAVPIEYDVPDTIYQFPLNYGSTDSNIFAYSFDLNNLGVALKTVVSGKRINEVHGWGSITTPYKTYSSVIKLKSTVITTDSIYTAENVTEKIDTAITYTWWDLNEKIPVFTAKTTVTNGITLNTSVNYVDTLICVKPKAFFVYAPIIPYYDTTTFSSTVTFTNLSASSDQLFWDFDHGNSSNEKFPTHTYDCPGTYNVKLIATNTLCTPEQADTISLAVVVVDSAQYFIKNSAAQLCTGDSLLINGTYEKTAGTFTKTFASSRGCDSIVTVVLTVTDLDTTLLSVGKSLSAKELNGEYQWVDCDNSLALVGDTNLTYTASQTGNYAVQITKKGCSVTTECKSVTITSVANSQVNNSKLFPNPTSGVITVDFNSASGGIVEINDLQGRTVLSKTCAVPVSQVNLDALPSGQYLVRLITKDSLSGKVFKIIRH